MSPMPRAPISRTRKRVSGSDAQHGERHAELVVERGAAWRSVGAAWPEHGGEQVLGAGRLALRAGQPEDGEPVGAAQPRPRRARERAAARAWGPRRRRSAAPVGRVPSTATAPASPACASVVVAVDVLAAKRDEQAAGAGLRGRRARPARSPVTAAGLPHASRRRRRRSAPGTRRSCGPARDPRIGLRAPDPVCVPSPTTRGPPHCGPPPSPSPPAGHRTSRTSRSTRRSRWRRRTSLAATSSTAATETRPGRRFEDRARGARGRPVPGRFSCGLAAVATHPRPRRATATRWSSPRHSYNGTRRASWPTSSCAGGSTTHAGRRHRHRGRRGGLRGRGAGLARVADQPGARGGRRARDRRGRPRGRRPRRGRQHLRHAAAAAAARARAPTSSCTRRRSTSPATATSSWAPSSPATTSCTTCSRGAATSMGAIPGPFEAWLALRGLRTLPPAASSAPRPTPRSWPSPAPAHPAIGRGPLPRLGRDGLDRAADAPTPPTCWSARHVAVGGRHQPRRRRVDLRAATALEVRAGHDPRGPGPALGRHRGRRGPLGRPRARRWTPHAG